MFVWEYGVQAAWQGPALLDRLRGGGAERLELPEVPSSGVHVDEAGRRLGLWTTDGAPGLASALPGLWPGWTIELWGDRYEQQLDRAGGAVAGPSIDLSDGVTTLAEALHRGRARDPVRRGLDTAAAIEASGRHVEINPDVTKNVAVAPTAPEWAAVDAALAELGHPERPAT